MLTYTKNSVKIKKNCGGFIMKTIKSLGWLAKIILPLLIVCIVAMFAGCSLFEFKTVESNQSNNTDSSANSGSGIDGNNSQSQSRSVKIYNEASDYKPTGTVDEPLITSQLLIDLTGVVGSNFKGNLKLDFKVDLAYKNDYTSPTPTFTFFYYSQNDVNSDYLLGQNTVSVLSKTKKTYTFSLNVYLEGSIIYGGRACNMDMGKDGNNMLGMYLDYRTYSLNNYYVTVTKL